MNDLIITMNVKIDRSTIHPDTSIQFVNNYGPDTDASIVRKYSNLSTDEKEALNVVLDKLTYEIEGGAFVFTINRDAKEFDLSSSYVRNAQSTASPLTEMTAGQSLLIRFEVPGFTENSFREVSLFYDQDFNPAELTDLEEIGIEITGNGKTFTITNTIECKVTFSKPDAVTDVYIINDINANEVILV